MEINISESALLEQTAEESVELAHSCLKMSRKIRGENPTPISNEEIINNLLEEVGDVILCINQLINKGILEEDAIYKIIDYKEARWKKRLEYEKDEKIEKLKDMIKSFKTFDDFSDAIIFILTEL